ncbi:glycosyltransferase [Curtobacterium sp. 1310]|uniref:glycosyltransferase n=1 Tax=Curtobacterium sp. 1310 TaxID=2806570 RepID=UPI001AE55DBB|nr:glycosyltransferase [Curtobacterium sp. 1310]MBP1301311.1 hypothetical protein [Curtobacterium sp. 1310]
MKVLYFAVHDEQYPRNTKVRQALTDAGHIVQIETVGRGSTIRKALSLLRRGLSERKKLDLVILSEFTQQFALVAWLIARLRGAKLAVDFFVGLYETRVEDHASVRACSVKGRLLWGLDWLALRIADLRFTDTAPRAQTIQTKFHVDEVLPVAVGAPAWASPQPASKSPRLRILYYGNYIPLHGLPLVVEALGALSTPKEFVVTFVGGSDRQRADLSAQLAQVQPELELHLQPPCKENELRDIIASNDVILGVFGSSRKAEEVVANKVWQGLLCGRIVITRESPALDEIANLMGELLVQVEPNQPARLTEALSSMRDATQRVLPFGELSERTRSLRQVIDTEMNELVITLQRLTEVRE